MLDLRNALSGNKTCVDSGSCQSAVTVFFVCVALWPLLFVAHFCAENPLPLLLREKYEFPKDNARQAALIPI